MKRAHAILAPALAQTIGKQRHTCMPYHLHTQTTDSYIPIRLLYLYTITSAINLHICTNDERRRLRIAQEVEFIWLRGLSENIFIYLHD